MLQIKNHFEDDNPKIRTPSQLLTAADLYEAFYLQFKNKEVDYLAIQALVDIPTDIKPTITTTFKKAYKANILLQIQELKKIFRIIILNR